MYQVKLTESRKVRSYRGNPDKSVAGNNYEMKAYIERHACKRVCRGSWFFSGNLIL